MDAWLEDKNRGWRKGSETKTLGKHFKHLLESVEFPPSFDQRLLNEDSWARPTDPDEILKELGSIACDELSRGNLLRQFSVRFPNGKPASIKIYFLKLGDPIKHIIGNSLVPYELVDICHCGQSGGEVTKIRHDHVKIEPATCTTDPTLIIGPPRLSPISVTPLGGSKSTSTPRKPVVSDGFRIIFSRDADASLERILEEDNNKPKRNHNFLYIEGADHLQVINHFKKVIATRNSSALGKLEYEEVELRWSDLDKSTRRDLLESRFEIRNEDLLEEMLNTTDTGSMVKGNLLLALLHTDKPLNNIMADARIFVDVKEWLKICPARQTVKSRNHFSFGMFTDSVLKGSKIELITEKSSGTTDKPGNNNSNPLVLDRTDSQEPPPPWEEGNQQQVAVVHTFELLEDGAFEYLSNYPNPYPEWELKKPPTFKWLATSPPEKFEQLQLLLMRQRVHSRPESEEGLLPPLSTSNPPPRRHCIISGESGIGKTTMLHVLASRLLDQHLTSQNGNNIVVFLKFRDVINLLQQPYYSQLDKDSLNKAIIESAKESVTMLEDEILANLKNKNSSAFVNVGLTRSTPVYLFLDGMDQIGFENLETGFKVVELIETNFPNVSLYVTTRPHLVLRLELLLKTFAVNLEGLKDEVSMPRQPLSYSKMLEIEKLGFIPEHLVCEMTATAKDVKKEDNEGYKEHVIAVQRANVQKSIIATQHKLNENLKTICHGEDLVCQTTVKDVKMEDNEGYDDYEHVIPAKRAHFHRPPANTTHHELDVVGWHTHTPRKTTSLTVDAYPEKQNTSIPLICTDHLNWNNEKLLQPFYDDSSLKIVLPAGSSAKVGFHVENVLKLKLGSSSKSLHSALQLLPPPVATIDLASQDIDNNPPPPTPDYKNHLQIGESYVKQMGSYVGAIIMRNRSGGYRNAALLSQVTGESTEELMFRAALRHYAIGLMCPGFESDPGYSAVVLGGITKQQLEASGLHPLPPEATSLVPARVAEFLIAELLKELLLLSWQNTWKEDQFVLLMSFLRKYYFLDFSKISVYDIHSVYNNPQLQASLHFANAYAILDIMLKGHLVTSRCPQIPKAFLLSAVYYGHQNIFKFLCEADEECRLKGDPKFVEFAIASSDKWDYVSPDPIAASWILPMMASFEADMATLVRMLEFQAKTKNGMFWNASSVYGMLFNDAHPGYVGRITRSLLGLMKAEQRRAGYLKLESVLVSQMFSLVANSDTINMTLQVRIFLEFLLSIDPTAANGIYREDYLTSLRLLTELKINPSHFSHQNPIFEDMYRLIAHYPADKLKLEYSIKELQEGVERGLEAFNLDESKWMSQIKTWYVKLYHQLLDKFYNLWLHKHVRWWAKEESLSKDVFLRGCATLALVIRFPERKAADFRLNMPSKFVEMLTEIGLLAKCKVTSKVVFFHPGICDYLIAWLLANVWFSVNHKEFTKFFMGSIMTTICPSGEKGSQAGIGNSSSNFKHFLTCYFLDELVNVRSKTGVILQRGTEACKMDNSWDIITGFENILQTCYDKKLYNVLNLFAKESYYEGRILKGGIMRALLFQVLENISRPLVNFASTLIMSARDLGLLMEIRSGNGESVVDVARRTCEGKPFEKEIMECFYSRSMRETRRRISKTSSSGS